jgi:glycosyltransferase involved in cell wall biosynthesis
MEVSFIRDLFRAGEDTANIPWVKIGKMPEREVVRILGGSAIFLSLARWEGCAQSVLEALASGCIVAGFTGVGPHGYASPLNGFWADEDDCLAAATQLRAAVRRVREGGMPYARMLMGGTLVANRHSLGVQAEKLVDFWRSYLRTGTFP